MLDGQQDLFILAKSDRTFSQEAWQFLSVGSKEDYWGVTVFVNVFFLFDDHCPRDSYILLQVCKSICQCVHVCVYLIVQLHALDKDLV